MDWAEAFWQCRRYWPACPEFGPDEFGLLSVRYVVDALNFGHEMRRKELHQEELGVANLTALMANINRDAKKNKKGFSLSDFAFYGTDEEQNLPETEAAAAYLHLIEKRQLPAWALFCYKEMQERGKDEAPPQPVAVLSPNAVLLAPQEKNGGLEGLLLARKEVSGQTIKAKIGAYEITMVIPEFDDQIIAREDVFIPVLD